jgi:hypothetical protein
VTKKLGCDNITRQKFNVNKIFFFFFFSRERDERKLQQRTNPKGSVTVNVNATDLFSRYKDEFDYDERLDLQILMCVKM